jgi:hypothetical protein
MCSIVLAGLGAVQPAIADVIYDNGTPDLLESYASDANWHSGYAEQADDFVLQPGATLLTDVHWWGVYAVAQTPLTDSFTIRLFEDVAGVPDTSHFYEVSGIDGSRVATGTLEDNLFEIYSYSADITPIQLNANTNYWISIVNDSTDPDDDWYWTTSNGTSGNSAGRFVDGGPWNDHGAELAFYLTGRSVVPEPASMTMLGLGLAALAYRRRKGAGA